MITKICRKQKKCWKVRWKISKLIKRNIAVFLKLSKEILMKHLLPNILHVYISSILIDYIFFEHFSPSFLLLYESSVFRVLNVLESLQFDLINQHEWNYSCHRNLEISTILNFAVWSGILWTCLSRTSTNKLNNERIRLLWRKRPVVICFNKTLNEASFGNE